MQPVQRGRAELKSQTYSLPASEKLSDALNNVHLALYLLFNEGIDLRNPSPEIHMDLCIDAIGLTKLLVDSPRFNNSETCALFALMHYHYARLPARCKEQRLSVPLDEQDRQKWHPHFIALGAKYLNQALDTSEGTPQKYLLEALITHEHCRAKSFESTDWQTILQHYDCLYAMTTSPVVGLNRAVAMAHVGRIEDALDAALKVVEQLSVDNAFQGHATLAYIYSLAEDRACALTHYRKSITGGLSDIEAKQLEKLILGV